MPSRPTSLNASERKREQALSDLARISHEWQNDSDVFTRLLRRMSTSLELKTLIDIFAEELSELVPSDRFSYDHDIGGQPVCLTMGQGGRHRCQYRLHLAGSDYGQLTLYRRTRFADQELAIIEQMLAVAINPIRNACQFTMVQQAALTDVVTGLPNKRAFEAAVQKEACLGNRHGDVCAMILCDLDRFKQVNDVYGHRTGDEVLAAVAGALRFAIRSSDSVFRVGGEEFAILLPRLGPRETVCVADRIRETIASIRIDKGGKQVRVTASAGIAAIGTSETSDDWFRRADKALYRAKSEGRNCTRVAPGYESPTVTPIETGRLPTR
jgi:diguanylate cyclase (GGDEF)-like protein